MKPDILIAVPIYAATMAALDRQFTTHRLFQAADRAAFLNGVRDKVRAIVTSGGAGADAALINALPKAEIIACFGVGIDAIDLGAARARNMAVSNTPDVLTEDVADLALGLILDSQRRISRGDRFVRAGNWLKGGLELGSALNGRKLGIVGLGRIGRATAQRAEAFGMRIAYHGPREKPDVPYPFFADLVDFITGGPLVAAVIEGPDAIVQWRNMMGATNPVNAAQGTIRGDLATEMQNNVTHGSDSPESAAREIALFFPGLG